MNSSSVLTRLWTLTQRDVYHLERSVCKVGRQEIRSEIRDTVIEAMGTARPQVVQRIHHEISDRLKDAVDEGYLNHATDPAIVAIFAAAVAELQPQLSPALRTRLREPWNLAMRNRAKLTKDTKMLAEMRNAIASI